MSLLCPDLDILAVSPEAGLYLAASKDGKHVFVTGHAEYDADTLKNEYERDIAKGMDMPVPRHYFPNDNPAGAHRHLAHTPIYFMPTG